MTIRLGLQIPNFSYGTPVTELFPTVVAQAREAQEAGFDAVFVMDHFYQLPMLGAPEEPMLEAYTALGALASLTERVLLGTLVTGIHHRHPAVLANMVSALDIISGGRVQMGIGAGWYEHEWRAYGYGFPSAGVRLARLDEGVQIMRDAWRDGRVSFDGEHYQVDHFQT